MAYNEKCGLCGIRLTSKNRKPGFGLHLYAILGDAWNQEYVWARAVSETVCRINAQPTARIDWFLFFRHGADFKRRQTRASTADGEDFKWSAEVEHFNFIKDNDADFACVNRQGALSLSRRFIPDLLTFPPACYLKFRPSLHVKFLEHIRSI